MIHSSNTSTSGAQTVGADSLFNTKNTITLPHSSLAVVLPLVGNLPSGKYKSEIVAVENAVHNGVIVGIDCTHKLTDIGGNSFKVKFRFFAPNDVETLAKMLDLYGCTGTIGDGLYGLQETVYVAPRPNSRYMSIIHRVLLSPCKSLIYNDIDLDEIIGN
jgi:hypothetical protein